MGKRFSEEQIIGFLSGLIADGGEGAVSADDEQGSDGTPQSASDQHERPCTAIPAA